MCFLKRALWGMIFILTTICAQGQSPHGKEFKISCDACHTADNWTVSRDSVFFNHDTTGFILQGQHRVVDCRQCHTALDFEKTETNCASCHIDIHQGTVGQDCARCHDSNSWLVSNIAEVHRQSSFPLLGAHAIASCTECHTSETNLRFAPTGDECIDCHIQNYDATTNPDHKMAGYSTDCIRCHKIDAFEWTASGINHDFFPLTQGHAINECAVCHKNSDYSSLSPECVTCHEADYLSTTSPNHQAINLSTSCTECHTTQLGWKPAEFKEHDVQYFPVYSGAHNGVWDKCVDCHKDPGNYSTFTCITCHRDPETSNIHGGVQGYSYNSTACLVCHPNGQADGLLNHDNTNFPLTGAHTSVECLSCHANGFAGTPTQCVACHTTDFNQSTNPNHTHLGLSTDCVICHTTAPNWTPAAFPNHNDYYVLSGAHATIANQCATCHQGNYNNTPSTCAGCHLQDYNQSTNPSHSTLHLSTDCATCHSENIWSPSSFNHDNVYVLHGAHTVIANQCASCHQNGVDNTPTTCVGCHLQDFNQTTDPSHAVLQFSTDCVTCHSENAWAPATFDHDEKYFPIYSGKHKGVWNQCVDCHTTPGNYVEYTCVTCHANPETNNKHNGISGYVYNSTACLACHPNGDALGGFDHNTTSFPLTGAHTTVNCLQCHSNGYAGTPTECVACHNVDFNQSTNPNHAALGLSTNCVTCHTTAPGWNPATFNNHNDFYVLSGAHALIASQCVTCHNGDYNNTPNTCVGCHQVDYNQTNNPNHQAAQFPTTCTTCHSQNAWTPANWNHDNLYFPIYSGKHKNKWDQCIDCHSNASNYATFTCITCHQQSQTNQQHNGVNGYQYVSTACLTCHPDGSAE
ncbi:MAG: hypothetical protein ABJB16_13035 [Saprospiraceae bacterium]